MNNSKTGLGKILPVFMSFIVMGFVDIIGVATGYVKQDFKLTDFIAQFLPMMVCSGSLCFQFLQVFCRISMANEIC